MDSTDIIIKKLKDGSESAFNNIFYEYKDIIFYMAYKYTKNVNESEDHVQEIFIKLLENIEKFEGGTKSFKVWFLKMAKNHLLNIKRNKTMHDKTIILDQETVDIECYENNTDQQIVMSEIEAAIGEQLYQILLLKIGFTMTYNEISELTGINASKVKRMYYHAFELAKEYVMKGRTSYGEKNKKFYNK